MRLEPAAPTRPGVASPLSHPDVGGLGLGGHPPPGGHGTRLAAAATIQDARGQKA